jgi:hypothetical protein
VQVAVAIAEEQGLGALTVPPASAELALPTNAV